jgi:hypothetical protein
MPAAIRPYSMAVAPDSSAKNLIKERSNVASSCCVGKVPMRQYLPCGS